MLSRLSTYYEGPKESNLDEEGFTCQRSNINDCTAFVFVLVSLKKERDEDSGEKRAGDAVDSDEIDDLLLREIMIVVEHIYSYVVDKDRYV